MPTLTKLGVPKNALVCTEGDPGCDFDTDSTGCTFHVTLCINNPDPRLPKCVLTDVASFEVRQPSPNSLDAADMANAAMLESQAQQAFGVTIRRGTVVQILGRPNPARGQCTLPFDIKVPLKVLKSGKSATGRRRLLLKTLNSLQKSSTDSLRLDCRPQ